MSTNPRLSQVGIEKIGAYAGTLAVDLLALARHRDHDPADISDNLLVTSRSINPLWEDPVTMAINAAKGMLTDADREAIELVIVGTESSVDQSKAMSTYAHRFLGLKPSCRNYESKHACYSGTSAVMMAAHWIASGVAPGKKALVITTDQSRESLNEHYEYVMGAGAVALLISEEPRVLQLDLTKNGYFTCEATDTFRPTSRVETGNNEVSLFSYLDALEGAYQHFLSKAGPIDYDAFFQWHLYHVPFGGMAFQAHRTALRQWRSMKKSEAHAHFERKVLPSLRYNQQLGGTYSGSTFFALLGLVDSCPDLKAGDRVSLFSYGSGSGGEFYPGVIGPDAKAACAAVRLQAQLDARRVLTIEEYEALERERQRLIDCGDYVPSHELPAGHYAERYAGQGALVFQGIQKHFRAYGWA
jgi:hydroxymethylglutaryl-CoA synthase